MSAVIERIEERPPALTPVVATNPAALLQLAVQQGADLDRLERLMALQERWEANEARKAYVAAMAEFKRNPPEILKEKLVSFTTRDGDTTSYFHATLGAVTQPIINGLAAHGISHRWDSKRGDGIIVVTCTLTHSLGHSESTSLEGAPDTSGKKNALQQMASTITYLQRYTLLMLTGIATKDMPDDDGAGGAEIPSELLAAARNAAMGGWKSLAEWINARTAEERDILGPESDNLKRAARNADKQGAPDAAS